MNATGHVYPDVLLKEKEKLSKDMEKAKTAYESEVTAFSSRLSKFTLGRMCTIFKYETLATCI